MGQKKENRTITDDRAIVLGEPQTREEVIGRLRKDEEMWSACYSADMLIRQFSRVKARKKEAFRMQSRFLIQDLKWICCRNIF